MRDRVIHLDGGVEEGQPLLLEAAGDPVIAALLQDICQTFERPPAGATMDRHLTSIRAQASARRGSGFRRAAILLAATLTLSMALVGFAYAGFVTLPEPVRHALSWIGIEVPASDKPAEQPEPADGVTGSTIVPSERPPAAPGVPQSDPSQPPKPAVQGDQPGRPAGSPGDQPGGGDRPDNPASPCPFPNDILGCDQSDRP